jgi:hypothetical protein
MPNKYIFADEAGCFTFNRNPNVSRERPVALPPEKGSPRCQTPPHNSSIGLLPSSAVRKLAIDEDLLLIGSVLALAAVALVFFWLLF